MRIAALSAAVVSAALSTGCSSSGSPDSARPARWVIRQHVGGVVDLARPRAGGGVIVAARGRLLHVRSGGAAAPFAPGYRAPVGLEPYIAVAGKGFARAGCRVAPGTVYALRLRGGNGVTAVSPAGRVRRFARLPSTGLENGIAFDGVGRFGHRLLVTRADHGHTTVYALDCHGTVKTVTRGAPRVEGGIAVAPRRFGRFGGDLIAPDEFSGKLYAIAPNGSTTVVARSGLPSGPDTGVESLGFVPGRFRRALVADRQARGAHPGDNAILALGASAVTARGLRAGDLLAVTEAGAVTIAIRCAASCAVRRIADGPPRAHVEGHVIFAGS